MMQTIIPALIAALATIVAAWLSRPQSQAAQSAQQRSSSIPLSVPTPQQGSTKISASLYFGFAGLVAWFLPFAGLPVTLIGIGFGLLHLSEYPQRRFARSGIWLNVFGLMASTANAAIGAYMGYQGKLF